MLKRKSSSRKGKEPNPSKVQSQGDSENGADRWYEFVRTLRTYYDHLRVAFSHMEEIPKYYSDDWGKTFRTNAQSFVQKEEMSSVRKVLVGIGYGTPKWDRFVERSPEEVSQAIDYLLENEGLIAGEGKAGPGGESDKERKAGKEPKAAGDDMSDGPGGTEEDKDPFEGADESVD